MIIVVIITRGKKRDVSRGRWGKGGGIVDDGGRQLPRQPIFKILFPVFFSLFIPGAPVMRRVNVAPPLPADGRGTRLPAFQPGLTIKTWATVARG